MDFANMELSSIILWVIETVLMLAGLAFAGVTIFKKYKGKAKLTAYEVLSLTRDLSNLAAQAVSTIEKLKNYNRDSFESTEEYEEFIANSLVDDFDRLINEIGADAIVNSVLYNRLSREEKIAIILTFVDKIPDGGNTATEIIEEDTTATPTVDISEML